MIANAFFSVVLRKRLIKFRSLVISVGFKSAEFERFQNFLCLELENEGLATFQLGNQLSCIS